MTDKVIENNQVTIMGEIVSDFTYSHEIFGEGFYMVDVKVPRLSESSDIIPMIPFIGVRISCDIRDRNVVLDLLSSSDFSSLF